MVWLVCVVFACLLRSAVQRSSPTDDGYVAAVVEYQTEGTTSLNLQNYVRFIKEAAEKNADIIVFPEMTLTRRESVEVPMGGRLLQYPIPALAPHLYHEVLVEISKAAIESQIYVVINIEELMNCTSNNGEYCPEVKSYLFNTNVVFDRSGSIIDRYRKINLFGEFSRTPALRPDLGVFATDFGVTFGHFICFDLMFQVPALQVVEKMNVSDVVFTTMWFSELPYLTAVQIQEAYAFAMNINFIGSGANNVRVGSAGSGIYSGKAGALVSTMPGLPVNRLLISKVPKVPGQVITSISGPTYDPPSDHDSLVLITDPSLPSHATRHLNPGFQEFSITDKDVTCTFRVNLTDNEISDGVEQYKYRAAAFSGVRSYSGVATGGTRICSVMACTGDTIDTCGKRFPKYNPKTTAIFHELSVVATVPTPLLTSVQAKDSAFFPISLDTSIMPLKPQHYNFTEDVQGNTTVYSMHLMNNKAELYTFAVWGRYYLTDGQDVDPPREEMDDVVTEGSQVVEVTDGGNGSDLASVPVTFTILLIPTSLVLLLPF